MIRPTVAALLAVGAGLALVRAGRMVSSAWPAPATYYVDAERGDDGRAGTSPESAWRTLARVGRQTFRPGERLLLRRGSVWTEGLRLRGEAPASDPIRLGAYGAGPRPRINGGCRHAITADGPISGWRITGLELTSTNHLNPTRRIRGGTCGIFFAQGQPCASLAIDDCLIHDTSGPGIYLLATGKPRAVFSNVGIERCAIWRASCGIQFWSTPFYTPDYFAGFRITRVVVHDVGGDGIVPFCGRDGVVEHCTVTRAGLGVDPRDHSPVAIWYAWAKDCVIQSCEASDTRTGGKHRDGGGFDLDGGCTGCVLQDNWSHDNRGAGYLLCSWRPRKWPCTGNICRYNCSGNDGLANDYSSLMIRRADGCQVYANTFIARTASALKFRSDTRGHLITDNVFYVNSLEDVPIVKSAFAIGRNWFRNNLYFRDSRTIRFEVQHRCLRDLGAFTERTGGQGERSGDPRFLDWPLGDPRSVDLARGDFRLLRGLLLR